MADAIYSICMNPSLFHYLQEEGKKEVDGITWEKVAFITELNANYYSLWFIRENGSDQYYRHNKGLLFDDRQKMLLGQMEEVENILNNGIK